VSAISHDAWPDTDCDKNNCIALHSPYFRAIPFSGAAGLAIF
jgi:hypothetical protein